MLRFKAGDLARVKYDIKDARKGQIVEIIKVGPFLAGSIVGTPDLDTGLNGVKRPTSNVDYLIIVLESTPWVTFVRDERLEPLNGDKKDEESFQSFLKKCDIYRMAREELSIVRKSKPVEET